jgi:hypothetical protein
MCESSANARLFPNGTWHSTWEVKSGSKVCRYERFARELGFSTALAYEAIFQVAVSGLFPALYQRIEVGVRGRAKRLLERGSYGTPGRIAIRRH